MIFLRGIDNLGRIMVVRRRKPDEFRRTIHRFSEEHQACHDDERYNNSSFGAVIPDNRMVIIVPPLLLRSRCTFDIDPPNCPPPSSTAVQPPAQHLSKNGSGGRKRVKLPRGLCRWSASIFCGTPGKTFLSTGWPPRDNDAGGVCIPITI